MTPPDPFASTRARVEAQLRAAARDFLDGDRASSDARRREAERIYRAEAERVATATLAAAWDRAVADERAARAAGGA